MSKPEIPERTILPRKLFLKMKHTCGQDWASDRHIFKVDIDCEKCLQKYWRDERAKEFDLGFQHPWSSRRKKRSLEQLDRDPSEWGR